MKIIRDINELKKKLVGIRESGKSVGLVPTMGFLHAGHLSLVKESQRQTGFTVMSIFVNPMQFGAGEDYDDYPRDLESDRKKAEEIGCDLIFYPRVGDMYPKGYCTFVNVEGISEPLCGNWRPGHFQGVTTVVAKLFNIVEPEKAFFGQKDAQQCAVIRRMAEDLNMKVEVIVCPTVREEDGLAMSSRNAYLSSGERARAVLLIDTLISAREMILNGEKNASRIKEYMVKSVEDEPLASLDYAEVVDNRDLKEKAEIEGEVLLALAVKFGKTRLIDNLVVEV